MAGKIVILKRSTFVSFFSKYFQVDESRANYFFSTWAIFLTHAEVRAAGDNSLKDALAIHISDVVNNASLLASKPLGKAQNYKDFVKMITPELHEFMKRDFDYIDDAIKDHEDNRKKQPGRMSPIDAVSIDLSLNGEKPTYERGGELLGAAGMALDRRLFLANGFLSSVGKGIAGWWSGTVDSAKIEVGVKQRDRQVIVPDMEVDSTVAPAQEKPKVATKNQSNTSDYTDPVFQELVESGAVKEGVSGAGTSKARRGTGNGGKLDVQLERKSAGGARSTSDSVRLTDSEYPVLQFIQDRANQN